MPLPQPRLVPDTPRADREGMDKHADPNVERARHPQEIEDDEPLLTREDLPTVFAISTVAEGHVDYLDERAALLEARDGVEQRMEALEEQIAELLHGP